MSFRGDRRPAAAPAAPPANGGFTLIELLIVVAIMAVILLVGIRLNRFLAPENDLDAAARTLSSAIELSRSEAIVGGRRVMVEFRLGKSADDVQYYRSIQEPLPGHEKEAEDDEFLLTVREWKSLPRGIRIESIILGETDPFTDGDVQVAIQPDGTMPSHLIRLHSPELDQGYDKRTGWACVQVAGLLGQARVLNRFVEPEFLRDDSF